VTPQVQRVFKALEAGERGKAEQLMIENVLPAQAQVIAPLSALLDYEIQETRQHVEQSRKSQNRARDLLIFSGLLGVLLTSGVLLLVSRKIGGLISHLTETGELLRKSNLNLQFQKRALDEHSIVSVSDVRGNIIEVNDKFCEVSQYSREELLGHNHRLLKSGQHPDSYYEVLWATISSGKMWHGEVCNRRKDGSLYWVESTILPFFGEDGLPIQYVSIRTEITPIKEAQLVLERSRGELEQLVQARTGELIEREELLHSITDAAHDAVIVIDPVGRVTFWNPAAERIFGYPWREINGKKLEDLIPPKQVSGESSTTYLCVAGSDEENPAAGGTTIVWAKCRNGESLPVEIALSPIKLSGKWSTVGIVRDATERIKTEERLKHLATTDVLTGICNRRHFDELLTNEVDRAARFNNPVSLILFDIDHFKHINDTFGHPTGDRVLIQLALTVNNSIRTIDVFARWGGEEFVILAPGCDLSAGRLLAEKLRMMLEKLDYADVGKVTCSFGVAEYVPGDSVTRLVEKADHCLYHAKNSGRNRVETTETTPAVEAI
jgi:diguanylate cyclase (GGDEF)-like protein/PAS domain S-box-containing protein